MRVIYDISALGAGYFSHTSRTGVARVIANQSRSLLARADLDISYCASASPRHLLQALRYLDSAEGGTNRFCFPEGTPGRMVARLLSAALPSPKFTSRQSGLGGRIDKLLAPLQHIIRSPGPDVLKNSDIFHATYFSIPEYVGRAPSVTPFITIHDLVPVLFPDLVTPNQQRNMRTTLANVGPATWALAISEATKADLCNHTSIDPSRVFVTMLAASDSFHVCRDLARMSATRQRYQIPEGPYVLSVCTLEPRKNLEHTIRSFVQLVRQQGIGDLNLVLVGTKGWSFDHIFDAILGADGLQDRIVTTGYVPDEDLAPLYSGAMMFSYPSLYEGFGLPPLEAMQCGTPVITSNTSSLPEVVSDAGIMIDPADDDALCQSMLDLYRSSDLRRDLGQRGIARAKLFSWARCAEQTAAAYRTALNR